MGKIELAGFFSFITNYIYSKELPPSVVKPQTPGVLGVKQFINIDYAYLTGFEFTYSTPQKYDWNLLLNAAYTFGVNPKPEGNEALAEIPPFESNLDFSWSFFDNRLVPELNWRLVAAQKRVSLDYNESPSEAFTTLDLNLLYLFDKYLKVRAGITNIFNTTYYEHLNRNQIGSQIPLYEMGRSFYLNLTFNL
jgi:outer membrane receptor protein involved in Fe transport